jgi:hypothetical protein
MMGRLLGTWLAVCLLLWGTAALGLDGKAAYVRSSSLKVLVLGGSTTTVDSSVLEARFSPDGAQIAYVRKNGSTSEIVVAKVDGSGKKVLAGGFKAASDTCPRLSWRIPNKIIFAHNKQAKLWSIDPTSGTIATFYTAGRTVSFATVSSDGKRLVLFHPGSVSANRIYTAVVATKVEKGIDEGCGSEISPDGSKFTNNDFSHQDMWIRNFDGSIYKTLSIAGLTTEYWNGQRWSNNSNKHFFYPQGKDYLAEPNANFWVMDISTGKRTQLTTGYHQEQPMDLWIGSTTPPPSPKIALAPTTLSFSAQQGGSNPASQSVKVGNSGGGTLGAVSATESAGWLTVSVGGSGNSQTLTNKVDTSGLAANTYTTTVKVSGGGATNSPTYKVTLDVTSPPPQNKAPVVNAGPDKTIELGATVDLKGSASDDGLPASAKLTLKWSKDSGPGAVTFFSAASASTQATFSAAGTYSLRLTASDGALQASDTAKVVVKPPVNPSITVLTPNGGEVWLVGSDQHITWAAVKSTDVAIELSTDDGATWKPIEYSIDDTQPGWLDYTWKVSNTPTKKARIRISDYITSSINDTSDAGFEITAPTSGATLALDPAGLAFAAIQGAGDPPPETVAVTNSGSGTLAPITIAIAYADGSGWLHVKAGGSGNAQTLANTVTSAGLTTGSYAATVKVAATGAVNSPQSYGVQLVVEPRPPDAGADLGVSDLGSEIDAGLGDGRAAGGDAVQTMAERRALEGGCGVGGGPGSDPRRSVGIVPLALLVLLWVRRSRRHRWRAAGATFSARPARRGRGARTRTAS